MTVANCPRCSEQVSIPESASSEATVQCPLCGEEYLLEEALSRLPPALIVVSDIDDAPSIALADADDTPWTALNLDDDGGDVELAPIGDGTDTSSAAPFDFTGGSAASAGKPTASIRPTSRSRKPKGSPIKTVLSIVIGGLMAFPIAQLILWYLPGDLKRDFGAGPIVAQYIPAIVPAKFRGNNGGSAAEPETAFQDSESSSSEFDFGSPNKFAGQDARASNEPNANRRKGRRDRQPPANEVIAEDNERHGDPTSDLDEAAAAGADVFGSALEMPEVEVDGVPTIEEPAPSEAPSSFEPLPAAISPATSDAPEPVASTLAPGNIRNVPQITPDEVVKRFQAALSGNLAWDTDEASSPSGALKREFYLSFSKLGEALTFAGRSDQKVATQIAETSKLLQEIGKQPEKLAVISGVANGWIAAGQQARTTNGICLYGVVTAVKPIGELFETSIECGGKSIAVVSTEDPSEYFVVDRHALVLGTILDLPQRELGGYEGDKSVVVLDGFHVNVTPE